jgi:hypothetical protein
MIKQPFIRKGSGIGSAPPVFLLYAAIFMTFKTVENWLTNGTALGFLVFILAGVHAHFRISAGSLARA